MLPVFLHALYTVMAGLAFLGVAGLFLDEPDASKGDLFIPPDKP